MADRPQTDLAAATLHSLLTGVLEAANPMLKASVNVEAVVKAMMRELCFDAASLRAVLRSDPWATKLAKCVHEAPFPQHLVPTHAP